MKDRHFPPTRKKMAVSLTPEPERFVAQRVACGLYSSASEVCRAALRLLKKEERHRLLAKELDHRPKNTLATVQSIAAQTLHGSRGSIAARAGWRGVSQLRYQRRGLRDRHACS